MGKGTRLTKQNYCTHCSFRERYDSKTYCLKYDININDAMDKCELLKPFDSFKQHKENDESIITYKKESI